MLRGALRSGRALSTLASTTARGEAVAMPPGLAVRTPLLESAPLSAVANTRVLLKLETAQPSGSFKDRGARSRDLAGLAFGGRGLMC